MGEVGTKFGVCHLLEGFPDGGGGMEGRSEEGWGETGGFVAGVGRGALFLEGCCDERGVWFGELGGGGGRGGFG